MNNETDKPAPSGEMEINTAQLSKYLFLRPLYSVVPPGVRCPHPLFSNENGWRVVLVEKCIFRNAKVFYSTGKHCRLSAMLYF